MIRLRNGDQRQILFEPIPSLIERGGQQRFVLQAMDQSEPGIALSPPETGPPCRVREDNCACNNSASLRNQNGETPPDSWRARPGSLIQNDNPSAVRLVVRAFLLEMPGISAVLCWAGLLASSRLKPARMRQIQDHEFLRHFRARHGKLPRDDPAPVVSYDDRAVASARANDRFHISDEKCKVVMLHPLGPVT